LEDTLGTLLEDLGGALAEFVPRLLGAVVVMVLALVVATVLQRLAARLLGALGLDELADRPAPRTPCDSSATMAAHRACWASSSSGACS
jgi:hypothetical protein